MFKEILSGLSKFFTRDRLFILIAVIVLGYVLFNYTDGKFTIRDSLETGTDSAEKKEPTVNEVPAQMVSSNDYSMKDVANPSDLLPKDDNSQWAALNPVAMNQGNINMPDLLQAGYHIGLDTIGQSLRNANYQLRSDPIIPKSEVGPWNQSTIEPDFGRVPLEIGAGSR